MQMKSVWKMLSAGAASLGMMALILDSQTALNGAADGISLCIRVVIPSLFPFFVLSIFLTAALRGRSISLLRPISRLCRMPEGSESILAVGLLGGYPVGAQAVFQAYNGRRLTRPAAHRLLGFCSNAGPAFIFGMGNALFIDKRCAWTLWGIQIISALMTGMLLPGGTSQLAAQSAEDAVSLPQAVTKALKVTAGVCGWIIVFRTLLAFLQRWFLWLLPNTFGVILTGLLELANGYDALTGIGSECMRFLLCACFLSFGGICVLMQTVSVTNSLGTGMYFPGKLLQTLLAFCLAGAAQRFLFPYDWNRTVYYTGVALLVIISAVVCFSAYKQKKTVAIRKNLVYNK